MRKRSLRCLSLVGGRTHHSFGSGGYNGVRKGLGQIVVVLRLPP